MGTTIKNKEGLEKALELWKEVSKEKKGEHFDLTDDSDWIKNVEKVKDTVDKLKNANGETEIRAILRELFRPGKNRLLWSVHTGIFVSFIKNCRRDELFHLRGIVLDIANSENFKEDWIEGFYSMIEDWNPKIVEKRKGLKGTLRNIIGELFGKLHIEKFPVMNACSRRFLEKFYESEKDDYNGFYRAFEEVKKAYLEVVGRLNESIPINAEIDMMFNYFDKDEKGEESLKELTKELPGKKIRDQPKDNHEKDTGKVADVESKEKIELLLNSKKQIILYGPPGTGKTWLAKKFVDKIIQEEAGSVEFVTFHPSYSYEEFVEGLRPVTDEEEGNIKYEVKDGIFKIICKNAYNALMQHAGVSKRWEKELPELDKTELSNVGESLKGAPKFFLIIDEINRGDISKIFGELITLLEADKRLFAENEIVTTLPYSKERFGVPPNLYIIGTMNTADRSIALIDVALRRRFGFIEVMPSYRVLINELGAGKVEREEDAINEITGWSENEIREDVKKLAIKALYILNQKIQLIYDRDHQIGHSYLLKLKDGSVETLKQIWYHEIIPLLQEYFYNDWQKLRYLLGEFVEEKQLREFADFELVDDEDARIYTIKHLDDADFIKAMVRITKAKSQSAG